MLFFIDESWHSKDSLKRKEAGVLAAISIKSRDFNKCSQGIYALKTSHLGYEAANLELKGRNVLKPYLFSLESKGIRSNQLDLVRAVLSYVTTLGTKAFASVVFDKEEIDLDCANSNSLERPFFFLFERINLFMKENHPDLIAKLVFDDRGLQTNQRISSAVSNFFHKSHTGQSFSRILKVPFFAISKENVGIQISDIVAYILGSQFTGTNSTHEFFKAVKAMEFRSIETIQIGKRELPWFGFKIIKEKEAGDLKALEGASKSIREPESSPPTPQ